MALEESDAEFYVACAKETGENTLVKLSYDPDVAATPQQELTVYSLEEDAGMRRLIARFQKQNPDIYVNYQIGLSGEDGVTASDALRMLNTEILAGDGPDVLMLDGISVDTYTEKGLLMDLTTLPIVLICYLKEKFCSRVRRKSWPRIRLYVKSI